MFGAKCLCHSHSFLDQDDRGLWYEIILVFNSFQIFTMAFSEAFNLLICIKTGYCIIVLQNPNKFEARHFLRLEFLLNGPTHGVNERRLC